MRLEQQKRLSVPQKMRREGKREKTGMATANYLHYTQTKKLQKYDLMKRIMTNS